MAITRCNKCTFLQEQPDNQIGLTVACSQCGGTTQVYDTIDFVRQLLARYVEARRSIASLTKPEAASLGTLVAGPANRREPYEVDLSNTDFLTTELQHGPVIDWFKKKHIHVEANLQSVDTTGFFDEVATSIGHNLPLMREVLDRIRWAQKNEYASTTIHIDKKSPADARELLTFCQQLYDFSFVAKCMHNRKENKILLVLQTAPAIRRFFDGDWLEWHALMTALDYCKTRQRRFSCARNLRITLQNGEKFELDVFMLVDGKLPICIECKTGEFRQDIDKYLKLRKAFGISGKSFIMCVAELDREQARGLTAMYDLGFVNESDLSGHLAKLF